jgi:rod shape-determining protein MreD
VRLLLLFTLATFVALVLQSALPRLLPIGILVPDLVLILAVDLGMRHPGALTAVMAFAMGYAVDAFSGVELGLNALLLMAVFIFSYWLSRVLISTSTAIGVIAVFAGVIFSDLGNYLISSRFTAADRLHTLMPAVLIQAAVTALLTPSVFRVTGWAGRAVGLRMHSTSNGEINRRKKDPSRSEAGAANHCIHALYRRGAERRGLTSLLSSNH